MAKPLTMGEVRGGAEWKCWHCSEYKEEVVTFTLHGATQFYCLRCLRNAIEGRVFALIVPDAGEATATTATTTATDSVTLPVIAHDDGSVTVGDIDIRW
jgi:hypothetical protein